MSRNRDGTFNQLLQMATHEASTPRSLQQPTQIRQNNIIVDANESRARLRRLVVASIVVLSIMIIATTIFLISILYTSNKDAAKPNQSNSLVMGILVFACCMTVMVIGRLLLTTTNLNMTCLTEVIMILHLVCLTIVIANYARTNQDNSVPAKIWLTVALNCILDILVFLAIIYLYRITPEDQRLDSQGILGSRRPRHRLSTTGSIEINVDIPHLNQNISVKPPQYEQVMPPEHLEQVDDWSAPAVHPGHAKIKISKSNMALFVKNPASQSHGKLPSYNSAMQLAQASGHGQERTSEEASNNIPLQPLLHADNRHVISNDDEEPLRTTEVPDELSEEVDVAQDPGLCMGTHHTDS